MSPRRKVLLVPIVAALAPRIVDTRNALGAMRSEKVYGL